MRNKKKKETISEQDVAEILDFVKRVNIPDRKTPEGQKEHEAFAKAFYKKYGVKFGEDG